MTQTSPQLKRNVAGYYAGGQFHPIRADKDKYDAGLAGDYDFPAERTERRAANRKKAEKNLEQQLENEIRREMFGDGGKVGKSLMQFVRAQGGINPVVSRRTGKAQHAGELDGLTFKQSKKRGLVSGKSKYSLDKMFQAAREEGYDVADENDLIDRLDDEARKGKATYKTHGYLDYRDNPTKKTMKGQVTQAQIKSTAATLAKLFPGENVSKIMTKLKRKNPDGSRLVENGILSRYAARHRAGRAYKQELRHKAAADRAAKKRAGHEEKARQNPRRASAKQPSLDFAVQGYVPAIMIDEKDLRTKAKYKNLRYEGKDEGDTYYRDPLTGYRYLTRENPAQVLKVKDFYQVKLPDGKYLRDGGGKVWKSRNKKMAVEIAAKTKTSAGAELNWLNSLQPNPMHPLSAFANGAVGIISALQIKDRWAVKKPAKRRAAAKKTTRKNPAPKRASGKVTMTVSELTDFLTNKKGRHEVWKNSDAHSVAKKSPRFTVSQSKNHKDKVLIKLKNNPYGATLDKATKARLARNAKKPVVKLGAKKPAAKKNPAKIGRRRAFEMFQGRPATNARPMAKSKHAPNNLESLGNLVEIKLANGEVLNFERVRNGKAVFPFELTMNPKATRLWIAGGKFARKNPSLGSGQVEIIEPIEHIVYATYKPHIEGDEVVRHYIHALGEETGEMPFLGVDNEGYPIIYGGAYTIEDRGIVN